MMKRFLMATSAVIALTGIGYGEEQRTMLTVENRFPKLHQFEAGAVGDHREFEGGSVSTLAPYVRYGIIPNLTVYGAIPVADSSKDFGGDGFGFGDVKAGVQLLAFEDALEYPWVVPHIDASFNTGDEGKSLGQGENVFTFGVSVGTKMYDQISFIVDASYALNGGRETTTHEDVAIFAGTILWDLSDKFAVLAEGKITDEKDVDNQPKYLQGGMVYKFTDDFSLGAYAGDWTDTDIQKSTVTVKASYSF